MASRNIEKDFLGKLASDMGGDNAKYGVGAEEWMYQLENVIDPEIMIPMRKIISNNLKKGDDDKPIVTKNTLNNKTVFENTIEDSNKLNTELSEFFLKQGMSKNVPTEMLFPVMDFYTKSSGMQPEEKEGFKKTIQNIKTVLEQLRGREKVEKDEEKPRKKVEKDETTEMEKIANVFKKEFEEVLVKESRTSTPEKSDSSSNAINLSGVEDLLYGLKDLPKTEEMNLEPPAKNQASSDRRRSSNIVMEGGEIAGKGLTQTPHGFDAGENRLLNKKATNPLTSPYSKKVGSDNSSVTSSQVTNSKTGTGIGPSDLSEFTSVPDTGPISNSHDNSNSSPKYHECKIPQRGTGHGKSTRPQDALAICQILQKNGIKAGISSDAKGLAEFQNLLQRENNIDITMYPEGTLPSGHNEALIKFSADSPWLSRIGDKTKKEMVIHLPVAALEKVPAINTDLSSARFAGQINLSSIENPLAKQLSQETEMLPKTEEVKNNKINTPVENNFNFTNLVEARRSGPKSNNNVRS